MSKELVYFGDPMCSWCWGFSTVIDHILHSFSGRLTVRLVMGGLRPGESEPMSDDDKVRTRLHWEQVETTSGQTFNFDFFQRKAFVNNTEPACRAVVGAGEMNMEHRQVWKNSLYEPSARVPLIISGPGVAKGKVVSDTLVSLLDIYPVRAHVVFPVTQCPLWSYLIQL